MDDLVFVVEGTAVPKQSFRYASGGGYQPERVKAWQAKVKRAGRMSYGDGPTSQDLAVSLRFFLPDRRRRDLDNLSKGTLDALTGVIWDDDQQIVQLTLSKQVSKNPRVVISVSETITEGPDERQMD